MCTHEKKTIDQAVILWKVIFLSNWIMPFSGVLRASDTSVLQTGNRITAMSKCRTRAAALAIGYVNPKVSLPFCKLSFNW